MPDARYVSTKNTTWTAPSASVRGPASRKISVLRPTEGELRELDEEHHRRARDDAVRERVDPDERGGEEREEDLHPVVHERRDRAGEELTVRLQHAGHERREPHEDRAEEHDPRELDREVELTRLSREAGRHDERWDDPGRREPHERRQDRERDDDDVHHARGDMPGFGLALLRQIAGEDGDERRGERSRNDEVEQRIRDAEGRPERVQLRRLSERGAEDRKTKPSQDPAGDERGDHDERRPRYGHRHASSMSAGSDTAL
jgi:hypothetical protein